MMKIKEKDIDNFFAILFLVMIIFVFGYFIYNNEFKNDETITMIIEYENQLEILKEFNITSTGKDEGLYTTCYGVRTRKIICDVKIINYTFHTDECHINPNYLEDMECVYYNVVME
jgi:hypothetical protein